MDFVEKDHNEPDSAREDVRGLIRGRPCVPQEAKRKYALTDSSDSTGIQKNKAGWAKVSEFSQVRFHIIFARNEAFQGSIHDR